MSTNCYNILGLNPGASEDDIKRAYKNLAKKYHPDKNTEPGAEEKFKEIAEAYQCLINPTTANFGSNINRTDFINPDDLFKQFITSHIGNPRGTRTGTGINININDILNNAHNQANTSSSTNFNVNNRNISGNVSGNFIARQSYISFQNGKKIEKIIETINGVRTEKTIVSDKNGNRLN